MHPLLERAKKVMPGGVSSPVRAFLAVGGEPPIVAHARGAEITDVDGKVYTDLVGSWGPMILGHSHPAVVEAIARAAREGLSFGATCEREVRLAEAVLSRFPWADKLRFVSTGTEAVMSAVRLARGATGRSRIVKFEACYHGHADSLLVKGGSGLATLGIPSSAGVPPALAELTEVLPLDDERAADALFAERGREIACVIIEPLPANSGLLVQRRSFLEHLRKLSREHGALLIFDEVISGLRVARGGMTEITGIEPDIVTLGKIVGGGMPVGAYLAKDALMTQVAPLGPVYQAGTLSGNPVAMAAGLATLELLEDPQVYRELDARGTMLARGFERALERFDVTGTVARVGSILWLSLQAGPPPRAWQAVDPRGARLYGRIHRHAMRNGLWMAPSAYEVAFVSLAHGAEHIERATRAFESALEAAREEG
ncbi:MAG: glutamate-1-semialdehyde 2,1-aminomutase [Planctomycetes bacterium]|nr:glutamate-1-semialdehyde 2,1-aminomutase [Planctomycetota bacterium]